MMVEGAVVRSSYSSWRIRREPPFHARSGGPFWGIVPFKTFLTKSAQQELPYPWGRRLVASGTCLPFPAAGCQDAGGAAFGPVVVGGTCPVYSAVHSGTRPMTRPVSQLMLMRIRWSWMCVWPVTCSVRQLCCSLTAAVRGGPAAAGMCWSSQYVIPGQRLAIHQWPHPHLACWKPAHPRYTHSSLCCRG